ncbi:hypothetical protein CO709_16040 [Burkholderia thailandensis]|nr:hypothetical protein CO709_16040 [Burkholderia thailandensis]
MADGNARPGESQPLNDVRRATCAKATIRTRPESRDPAQTREAPRRRAHYVHNGAIDTTFARRRCTIHA